MAIINRDIFIGAFIGIEYQMAIDNADAFMQTVAQFESDIELLSAATISDSYDDVAINFAFIIPSQFVDNSAYENELDNELYSYLDSSELHSALIRAYQSAIDFIRFMKGKAI